MNTTPTENVLTTQVAQYLRLLQRQGKVLCYTHIANETMSLMMRFRNGRLGLTPGVPDMLIVTPYTVLFLELKREKGSVTSPAQKVWIEALQKRPGVCARVAKGFTEAKQIIDTMV